jgi:hypothetical protein
MLLVVSIVLSASSCQEQAKPIEDTLAKQVIDSIIVKSVQSDPRTNELPTKLNEFSFDLNLDNAEEKIELYTAAGYGPDGKMLWDDGQRWLLVVVDGNKYYPLYSEFVQLGEVYFSISKVGEQMIPQVNVYISTQSGMEIVDFVFNNEKEQYEGEVVYRPKEEVRYYSSIPSY